MKQNLILWAAALLITFLAGYFKAVTDDNYPVTKTVGIDGKKTSFKFDKITYAKEEHEIYVYSELKELTGELQWRNKGTSVWNSETLVRDGRVLKAALPKQPVKKVNEYRVRLEHNGKEYIEPADGNIDILNMGYIPPIINFLMWFTLLTGLFLSIRTGLEYFNDREKTKVYSIFTLIFFILYFITTPLYKSYEMDVINKYVPNITEIFTTASILFMAIWVFGMIGIFTFKKRRLFALYMAAFTLSLYLVI
jgi:hypothetical protein